MCYRDTARHIDTQSVLCVKYLHPHVHGLTAPISTLQKLYRITEADLQEVAGSFRGFEDSAIDIGTQMWVLTPTCISCMISFVHSI